jgi:type VI secretion system protein ImpC
MTENVLQRAEAVLRAIDAALSWQLALIMHHPSFQKLEGAWRGLHYLAANVEASAGLKLKVLNVTKKELLRDFDRAVYPDEWTIRTLLGYEIQSPKGEPFGVLIGDYEFTNHPEDIELLVKMSQVGAECFCPFISAASHELFGLKEWGELARVGDPTRAFDALEYIKWRSYRDSEDSRFVALALPRVLARQPYRNDRHPVEEFDFVETGMEETGKATSSPHDHFTWMNVAYVLGARLARAFELTGLCAAIRGREDGEIRNLPTYIFMSDSSEPAFECPTEVAIGRYEYELSRLGFVPLCSDWRGGTAVFFGAQTTQRPKRYGIAEATENAAISARLPYVMVVSRFVHHLMVMAREWLAGPSVGREELERRLGQWIDGYVGSDDEGGPKVRAFYPLRESMVRVLDVPGRPGGYNVQAFLRPRLPYEELTAALMVVFRLPWAG